MAIAGSCDWRSRKVQRGGGDLRDTTLTVIQPKADGRITNNRNLSNKN